MMEDVCILICIPQTSASRKLSLAAGRAIDADDGSRESPALFLFHRARASSRGADIHTVPLQMGFSDGKLMNWAPPKKGAGVAS